MPPAMSRGGDGFPFADTDFSKAKGIHHYSRPSVLRSLESRAAASVWDYCSKSGLLAVPSSGSNKEDHADLNKPSKNSVSNFWIRSQHECNNIELTPSTGGIKVVLHGDIREMTSAKPSPKGIMVEVRIHAKSASNQEYSEEDQLEDAHKPLEGVCIMNECLHMVDFKKALRTAYRNSLLVSKIADALQDPSITQTTDGTLWLLTARSGHMAGRT